MPKQGTTHSPELLLALDRGAAEPLRSQLERRLRDAIRSGRLRPGTRIPSSRALARDLGVTRGLVVDCYEQLRAEGYLSALGGSGTTVAAGATFTPPTARKHEAATRLRFDLRPGLPDLASFPRREWAAAIRRAIGDAPDAALGYGDPRGAVELRCALAAYLGRVRGAYADPGRIVVCAGFAQARNLVFRVLKARGASRVALEDPCQPESRLAVTRAGLKPVPATVDADGVRISEVRRASADLLLATPAHQFPTGVVLAAERRRELLDWAREHGALVLEDDYDAEYRYDRKAVGALQGLAPDHVIYAGSVSKALAPSVRIGWLHCPPGLSEEIAETKRAEDLGSPLFEQLALADLLDSGRYDRQLRRARANYRRRRDTLAAALRRRLPEIELGGIAAGIHAVAGLPERIDETALVRAASERSVGVYGLSAYRFDAATTPPALVLGYGNIHPHALDEAVNRLAQAVSDVRG